MYELIITISNNVIYNENYNSLEELQDYIYYIETLNKNKNKKKKRMLFEIKSYLPNDKIVVTFD